MPSISQAPGRLLYTVLYMAATRTQIYLSAEQRRRLDDHGRRTGEPLAQMIREAVDAYLGADETAVAEAFDETFGTLPELELPDRDEWEPPAADDADPGR